MKRIFILLLLWSVAGLISIHSHAQNPEPKVVKLYKLVKVSHNSDFDYEKLSNIDALVPPYPKNSKYQIGDLPIKKGKFTIYRFMAEYPGQSAGNGKKFHNLLIVKADRKGKITDAFHYTLEWQDSPSLCLYRLENKDVNLSNFTVLSQLKLKNMTTNKMLNDYGAIVIPPS